MMLKINKWLLKCYKMMLLAIAISLLVGCRRSDDDFDNRTLENRSHVETVKPDNRGDPFRP